MTPDSQLAPMLKYNAENERTKRRYLAFLKEAKRRDEKSLDAAAKALRRFEAYNRFRSFKAFHVEQASAFKRHLAEQATNRTGKLLSKATVVSTLAALKAFFVWLADQPGYRRRLEYSHAEYFNPSERDGRIAAARRQGPFPSLEQVRRVIGGMSSGTAIERRDRALIAFILLTGARDGAVTSLKLKHLDLAGGCVAQDAREVATKFAKSFTTWFFPVGQEVREVVEKWADFLDRELLWGPDDPLFPATHVGLGEDRTFQRMGLARRHWTTAEPIREAFKRGFGGAGLPYFPPHSLRKTLVQLGEQLCQSPEEFKAWSQNLGHSGVLTTFTSYGNVADDRQAAIIRMLGQPKASQVETANQLAQLAEALRRGAQP
jgi:integrase/recombinase XerD